MWNGSPESFFHPRDVDWKAIASSLWELWGDFGDFEIFNGEHRSVPELPRAPWALVKEPSGVRIPHLNKRRHIFWW